MFSFETYFFPLFFIEEFEKAKNDDKERETVSDKFRKELEREKMMKIEAINKLAEIMNRIPKDNSRRENSRAHNLLRKKEKECKKLQQELTGVR